MLFNPLLYLVPEPQCLCQFFRHCVGDKPRGSCPRCWSDPTPALTGPGPRTATRGLSPPSNSQRGGKQLQTPDGGRLKHLININSQLAFANFSFACCLGEVYLYVWLHLKFEWQGTAALRFKVQNFPKLMFKHFKKMRNTYSPFLFIAHFNCLVNRSSQ